ncbi:hypothetical protein H4R33_006198 [Dimargaris cristalligena]|nr:hypothetical protein H4R33_006198 [Dimargaris cristalligena]
MSIHASPVYRPTVDLNQQYPSGNSYSNNGFEYELKTSFTGYGTTPKASTGGYQPDDFSPSYGPEQVLGTTGHGYSPFGGKPQYTDDQELVGESEPNYDHSLISNRYHPNGMYKGGHRRHHFQNPESMPVRGDGSISADPSRNGDLNFGNSNKASEKSQNSDKVRYTTSDFYNPYADYDFSQRPDFDPKIVDAWNKEQEAEEAPWVPSQNQSTNLYPLIRANKREDQSYDQLPKPYSPSTSDYSYLLKTISVEGQILPAVWPKR